MKCLTLVVLASALQLSAAPNSAEQGISFYSSTQPLNTQERGTTSPSLKKETKTTVVSDKDLSQNPSEIFLKAKTFEAIGSLKEALELYQKLTVMQENQDGIFISTFKKRSISESLDYPKNEIINPYLAAYNTNPARVEPLYKLARDQCKIGDKESAFSTTSNALSLKKPQKIDSANAWIDDYGLLQEHSLLAEETNHLQQALLSHSPLNEKNLPQNIKELETNHFTNIQANVHQTALPNIYNFQRTLPLMEVIDYSSEFASKSSNAPSNISTNEALSITAQKEELIPVEQTVNNTSKAPENSADNKSEASLVQKIDAPILEVIANDTIKKVEHNHIENIETASNLSLIQPENEQAATKTQLEANNASISNDYAITQPLNTQERGTTSPSFKKETKTTVVSDKDLQNLSEIILKAKIFEAIGILKEALELYQKLTVMQGNQDEIFISTCKKRSISGSLNYPKNEIINAYLAAYNTNPSRVEPLYKLARDQCKIGDKESAFSTNSNAPSLKKPQKIDSANAWIDDYGLLQEHSLLAEETNHLQQALLSHSPLNEKNLPQNIKELATNHFTNIQANVHRTALPNIYNFQRTLPLMEVIDYSSEFASKSSNAPSNISTNEALSITAQKEELIPAEQTVNNTSKAPENSADNKSEISLVQKIDAPILEVTANDTIKKEEHNHVENIETASNLSLIQPENEQDATKTQLEVNYASISNDSDIIDDKEAKSSECLSQQIEQTDPETFESGVLVDVRAPIACEGKTSNQQEYSNRKDDSKASIAYNSYSGQSYSASSEAYIAYEQSNPEPASTTIAYERLYNRNGGCSEPVHGYPSYQDDCCGYYCDGCCDSYEFKSRLYMLGVFGEGLGDINTYQSIGTVLTYQKNSFVPFVELQGLNFCNDQWGANLGGGLRYFNKCSKTIFGVNAFFDFRDLYSKYNQFGVGIEILGRYFDVYANVYLPTNSVKRSGRSNRFEYPGDYYAISTPYSALLRGFDAELGTNSRQWCRRSPLNLYVGTGIYSYKGKSPFVSNFTGVRYRADISYYDLINIGLTGTYDSVNRNNIQGYVALTMPFDACGFSFCEHMKQWCSCWYETRLTRPVQRNPAIFLSDRCCEWETNY